MNGVYRIAGALQHAPGAKPDPIESNAACNGLHSARTESPFRPTRSILYVNNSEPKKFWMRYPVKADGSIGKG